jgi:hypothetical protein
LNHSNDHPLPVQWLARLDHGLSPADEQLLEACAACQESVARLRDAPEVSPTSALDERRGRMARPPASRLPRRGELWSAGANAQQVLVLAGPTEEFGTSWWSVIAADEDPRARLDSDALLHPSETSLERPIRIRVALQAPLPRDAFSLRLGEITDAGADALAAILVRDQAVAERFGPPPTASDDWRLRLDAIAAPSWHELAATHPTAASAARTASAGFLQTLKDARSRLAGGAFRGPLASAAEALGRMEQLWPSADDWNAAAATLRGAALLDPTAAGLVPPRDSAAGWPLTLGPDSPLRLSVTLDEPLIRVAISGIPDALEGTTIVCVLPAVGPEAAEGAWLGGIPGVLLSDDPVDGGRATVTFRSVAPIDHNAVVRNLMILPPGLAS